MDFLSFVPTNQINERMNRHHLKGRLCCCSSLGINLVIFFYCLICWLSLTAFNPCLAHDRPVQPTKQEAAFWEWLRENGADVSNIAWPVMTPAAGSRGVMAIRDIPARTSAHPGYYIQIPKRLWITEQRVLRDPDFGPAISWFRSRNQEQDRIALYLVFQANRTSSFFYPFMRLLDEEPSVFAEWSETDLKAFQDVELVEAAKWRMKEWRLKLSKLSKEHFPQELFTWERFKWAMSHVSQRTFAFTVPLGESNVIHAMVPGADLFNHANVEATWEINDDMQYVSFPKTRDVHKGEECFLSYGRFSNRVLLINYGFALRGNRFDEVLINNTIVLKDISAFGEGLLPGQAIRQFQENEKKLIPATVLAKCLNVLRDRLKRFGTTVDEDLNLLKKLPVNSAWKLRFALPYRIGQKLICESYLKYCQAASELIPLSKSRMTMSSEEFDVFVMKAVKQVEGKDDSSPKKKWFELDSVHKSRLAIVAEFEAHIQQQWEQKKDEL